MPNEDLDTVKVATSGTINRHDCCSSCGVPMLYRVDELGTVWETFCGNSVCIAFLIEIPE